MMRNTLPPFGGARRKPRLIASSLPRLLAGVARVSHSSVTMAAPVLRWNTCGEASSETKTDFPAALWPVTTRRTVMVDPCSRWKLVRRSRPSISASMGRAEERLPAPLELARWIGERERTKLSGRRPGEARVDEAGDRRFLVDDPCLVVERLDAGDAVERDAAGGR